MHWDKKVDSVKWGLNNTINQATGQMATELMFGFRPRHRSEAQLLNQIDEPKIAQKRSIMRQRASSKIKENQEKAKARYDLRRAPAKSFKKGDAVGVLREISSNNGKSKKLLGDYAGPYEIKEVLDRDRYVVGDIKGAQRTQKPYCGTFPGESIKMWESIVSSDDNSSSDSESESHPPAKVQLLTSLPRH